MLWAASFLSNAPSICWVFTNLEVTHRFIQFAQRHIELHLQQCDALRLPQRTKPRQFFRIRFHANLLS
jgi:hypothetical protein